MIRWKIGKNGGAIFRGRSGNLCLLTPQFGIFYRVSKPYLHREMISKMYLIEKEEVTL